MTTFPMPTAEPALSARDDRGPEADADPGISDLLDSIGTGTGTFAVTLYRGTNQQGEFLTTYEGPDFTLSRVQADYGPGRYFAQVKRDSRMFRGVRFSIGPKPRAVAEAEAKPAPAPAPAPAPVAGLDPITLLMATIDRQQAMILALLNRPATAAPATDPLAALDRAIKLVQPRNQLSEVLDAMRAVRELSASESAQAGGSEWGELVRALPGVLQSIIPPAGSIDSHPVVRKARQIVAMAEARKQPAGVQSPAPKPAPAIVAESQGKPIEVRSVQADDFRLGWIRDAVPMLRLVLPLPDTDPEAYAQVAIDAIEAKGMTVGDVVKHPGELVSMVLAEAPDLAQYRPVLDAIEAAILSCDQPDDDDRDPMGGALDDNGRPRAGDPRQFPKPSAA